MSNHLQDPEIRSVFQFAVELGEKQLKDVEKFLREEHYTIPKGFGEEDVNVKAPKLFSDEYCLQYLYVMSMHGTHGYSAAATTSIRSDVRKYFNKCLKDSADLHSRLTDILLSKGLCEQPSFVQATEGIDTIDSANFFTGWFGNRRPLNCLEIANITFNYIKSEMTRTLLQGFAQTSQSEEVKTFFLKVIETANEHLAMFAEAFDESNLPTPKSWNAQVTESVSPVFSEKLMMYFGGFLVSLAMTYYGVGLSCAMRNDLAVKFMDSIGGDLKLAKAWSDILVKNQWLEQPPQAVDRRKLVTSR
jgi:hypothetical protein